MLGKYPLKQEPDMYGYMDRILRVNLSHKKVREEPLNPEWAGVFLGGSGYAIRMAFEEIEPGIDPLGPASKLIFMTGPLTGTVLGTTGRFELVFKSPLTGLLCDSSSSGFFGAELKMAGYDGLVIEGESDEPVYLWINDGTVEVRDAVHLWGMDALNTQKKLLEELGDPKARVLAVGEAAENGVLYSCAINDAGRAPGRGGSGAIFGKKKLKAIVVRGSKKVKLAHPKEYTKAAVFMNKTNATHPVMKGVKDVGTSGDLDGLWALGDVPVKNWSKGSYEEICTNLGGARMRDTILVRHSSCYRCTINCCRWVKVDDDPYRMDGPGPEYETLAALGSLCMVDDQKAVAYANDLCNRYGIDTISCGGSIAFAMECYEKQLITKDDTDGVELTWGNKDAVLAMIHKIGKGEGFGKILGTGIRNMAEGMNGKADEFAMHVKGMELPMHDPRCFFAWAGTYASGPRGACHLHGLSLWYELGPDPLPEWGLSGEYPRQSDEAKGKVVRVGQSFAHVVNSSVVCYFSMIVHKPHHLAELLSYAVGRKISVEDLLALGDRIHITHHAYNYLCGNRREDERLPERVLTPLPDGGTEGRVPDPDKQLEELYELRGLHADGKPSRKILRTLELKDIEKKLY